MIIFKCWQCGEKLEAPESLSGEQIDCPVCGEMSNIPKTLKNSTRQIDKLIQTFDNTSNVNVKKVLKMKYAVGRIILIINIILGWLLVTVSCTIFVYSLLNTGMIFSSALFFSLFIPTLIGFQLIAFSHVALSIIDTASNTGEILRLISKHKS